MWRTSDVCYQVASSLDRAGFSQLCPASSQFSGNVFSGVGELLNGLKAISATFNGQTEEGDKLDETVALIKEGAVSFSLNVYY